MLKANITELRDERHTIENYPDERASYEDRGDLFPWREDEYGQLGLISLYFYMEPRMSIAQAICGHPYKRYGITAQGAYEFLQKVVPELFPRYEKLIGRVMPVTLPRARIYMWFLKAVEKGCLKELTLEHPLRWATPAQLNEVLQRSIKAGV